MANWYVDEINGNDSTGSGTTAAPYKTIVKVLTVISPGDVIYGGNGLEVISSLITFPAIAGTASTGYTRFIACTISGTTWTPVVGTGNWGINANSAAASCINFASTSALVSFEGMEFKNSTSHLITTGSVATNQFRFMDCYLHNAGGQLFSIPSGDASGWMLLRCKIYSNTSSGIIGVYQVRVHDCEIYSNGGYGITPYTGAMGAISGNIIRNNTTGGINTATAQADISENVIDNNPIGIAITSTVGTNSCINLIRRNCITNCSSYGIRAGTSGQFAMEDANYFFNNGVDISVVAGANIISLGTSLLAQAVTPYVTPGSDFTRKQGTGLRFTDLLMPSGVVHQGVTAGLPVIPNLISCQGGHRQMMSV
jgi:hypothetical protein